MKIKKYFPVIGIAIFLYILFKLDISTVIREISNAKISYLLIAVFFILVSLVTQTLKWFVIAKVQKIEVPFIEAVKINLISIFYGSVTPSRIGGAIRAEYLKKYNHSGLGKGIGNFTLDKVLDLCSLVFLVVIFSFVFRGIIPGTYLQYSIMLLALLVGLLIIFSDRKRSRILLGIIYRKLVPDKLKYKLKMGFDSFYEDMPKKRYFPLFFLLNLFNWVVLFATTFFVGRSLGIDISFFYFLAIMPIATLVAQIPITIAGLGTREITLIYLFKLFSIEPTKVFSMSLIAMFLWFIPSFMGIFLVIKKTRRNHEKNFNHNSMQKN
ncbi:MAG: lysylphosphatidylglycerol synthase transmembrane domain-containing protein [archaeon]